MYIYIKYGTVKKIIIWIQIHIVYLKIIRTKQDFKAVERIMYKRVKPKHPNNHA